MNKIITFHDFEIRETQSALGGTRKQAFDKTGEHYELREVFDAYMRFGGMPGIADAGLDQEKALGYLRYLLNCYYERYSRTRKSQRSKENH